MLVGTTPSKAPPAMVPMMDPPAMTSKNVLLCDRTAKDLSWL